MGVPLILIEATALPYEVAALIYTPPTVAENICSPHPSTCDANNR